MSNLVVIGYDDVHKAEEVRLTLAKLEQEELIDLEDAAVVIRTPDGQIKLNQSVNLVDQRAATGGFWGMLVGILLMSPLIGAGLGIAVGAISGALGDIGINDAFMKRLASTLTPGSSALFVLVRKSTPEKVVPIVGQFGGTVLQTSLTHEKEEQLRAALKAAQE